MVLPAVIADLSHIVILLVLVACNSEEVVVATRQLASISSRGLVYAVFLTRNPKWHLHLHKGN
jgi:hypothetical protein